MSTPLTVALLAANDTGPEFGKAAPIGLVIIIVLLVGTFALIRSMNKHMMKLPDSFDRESPEADQLVDEGTDRGAEDTSSK